MGALTYRSDGNGGVLLTLTGANGYAVTAHVTEGYVKSRAWAILADFDPDGVDALDAPATPARRGANPARSGVAEVAAARKSMGGTITQRDKVLMALAAGQTKAGPISHQLGALRPSISGRLIELLDADLAICLQKGGGRGRAAIYGLTRDGAVRALALGMTAEQFAPDAARLIPDLLTGLIGDAAASPREGA